MKLKFFLISLMGLTLFGCSSAPFVVTTTIKKHDFPELNVVATAELGDTIVSHLYSATSPSYQLLDTFSTSAGGGQMLPAGYILRPKYEDEKYEAFFELGLCRAKNSEAWCMGQSGFGICNSLTCGLQKVYIREGELRATKADYIDVTQPNLQQELIYHGRIGNSVKFLYRELTTTLPTTLRNTPLLSVSQNVMRNAFSQDIQYDLSEGNEIGFKGVRLEIIEATNRKITYKVSKHFIQ